MGTSHPYFGDSFLLLFVLASSLPQLENCPTKNYELPIHIEDFLDIHLSLDLNQPLLSLYQRPFVIQRAIRAPLTQTKPAINHPKLDGIPSKLGFDSSS